MKALLKTLFLILVTLVIIAVLGGGMYSAMKLYRPNDRPIFSTGDMVESKISGQQGQVLRCICMNKTWKYKIRFSSNTIVTNTHLLSKDGPIKRQGLEIVWMYEYEIRISDITEKK